MTDQLSPEKLHELAAAVGNMTPGEWNTSDWDKQKHTMFTPRIWATEGTGSKALAEMFDWHTRDAAAICLLRNHADELIEMARQYSELRDYVIDGERCSCVDMGNGSVSQCIRCRLVGER